MDAHSDDGSDTSIADERRVPAPPAGSNRMRPWSAKTQASTLSKYGVRTVSTPVGTKAPIGSPSRLVQTSATTRRSDSRARSRAEDDRWRPESVIKQWQEGVGQKYRSNTSSRPLTSRSVSALMEKYLQRKEKKTPAFSTNFHVKRNDDLRLEQHHNFSIAAAERQLTVSGVSCGVKRVPSTDAKPTCHSTTFRTAWRTARNSDLRGDAIRNMSLGLHNEPFVEPEEKKKMRRSKQEQESSLAATKSAAEARSRKRPETPRSVSGFFGDDDEFVQQDMAYSKTLKSKILNATACTVASRPSSARPASATVRRTTQPTPTPPKNTRKKPQQSVATGRASSRIHFEEDPRNVAAWVQHVRAAAADDT